MQAAILDFTRLQSVSTGSEQANDRCFDFCFDIPVAMQPSREESQENYLRNWEENGELTLSLSVSEHGSSGPTDSSFKEWFDVRRKVGASFFSEEARERYMKLIEASMPLDPRAAFAKASGNLNGDEGPTDISFQDWFAVRRRVRFATVSIQPL